MAILSTMCRRLGRPLSDRGRVCVARPRSDVTDREHGMRMASAVGSNKSREIPMHAPWRSPDLSLQLSRRPGSMPVRTSTSNLHCVPAPDGPGCRRACASALLSGRFVEHIGASGAMIHHENACFCLVTMDAEEVPGRPSDVMRRIRQGFDRGRFASRWTGKKATPLAARCMFSRKERSYSAMPGFARPMMIKNKVECRAGACQRSAKGDCQPLGDICQQRSGDSQ